MADIAQKAIFVAIEEQVFLRKLSLALTVPVELWITHLIR
jgi:hypothetical protein